MQHFCIACKQSFRNDKDELLYDADTKRSVHKDCLQAVVKQYPTSEVAQNMGYLLEEDDSSDDSFGGMG